MEEKKYNDILCFLKDGTLPKKYPSTKGNFVRMSQQFHINANDRLMFGDKIAILLKERSSVWAEFHSHSGRDKCWKRIKDR